jgi:5-(hydroxymethyl)furfural/furfural oxidase
MAGNAQSEAMDADRFDVIVVGGGAAGSTLAARLSERPGRRVLLIEAGRDSPPGREPADVSDVYPSSYYNKAYMWPGQKVHWRRRDTSPAVAMDQGRIMGGGSAVMGMVALRGTPDDYDEWERMGAKGWSWQDVLPYFRKLENDSDFDGPLHGTSGPVPIRRVPREQWTPIAKAISAFAAERQMASIDDMNADFRDGYCALPMSNWPDKRASSAIAYLTRDVRTRPNLRILSHALVTALRFDGRKVTGVEVDHAGSRRTFAAGETILSAGALRSPAILMRAGIGPAETLTKHGVAVRHALDGVGANLMNHPVMFIGMHLRKPNRHQRELRSLQISTIRYSSGVPGCPPTDMIINIQSKSSWNELGAQIGNFGPVLWKPFSRGTVSLASADPLEPPLVECNFLDDERDLKRMIAGFRLAAEMLTSPSVARLGGKPFPVSYTDRLRRLNQLNRQNAVKTAAIARLLDVAPAMSDRLLASLTSGIGDIKALVADEARITEHVKTNIAGTFHICGTAKMGLAEDRMAVVDSAGRVHGIAGLRVADAAIMPFVPRANTNIPSIMIGEKIAAAIDAAT